MFDPSTTVFLIVCSNETGFALSKADVVNAISNAELSWLNGGWSSNSINPEFGDWTYSKERLRRASKRAAMSILPPSPLAALNLREKRGHSFGRVSIVTSYKSPGCLECNLPVANC